MSMIGVVEGFFGPAWSVEGRESYAAYLASIKADFFIYAPKQDQHLRKGWRDEWDPEYLDFLKHLRTVFQAQGIKFGVALSPFGLGLKLSPEEARLLEKRVEFLRDLEIDILGLFFDDMPTHEKLAEVQIEAMTLVEKKFSKQIIFCPTYYTFDPILEKVFGKMPEGYLEKIGLEIPSRISIAWTGPKVISPEIPAGHLKEVEKLLKRRPFIWENLFANDGPKNCKFIKVRPYDGRDAEAGAIAEAWGFNMMNQPYLSQLDLRASQLVLQKGLSPEGAFTQTLEELCTPAFKTFLETHRLELQTKGLDHFTPEEKDSLMNKLRSFPDPGAREILDWFEGFYNVGSECLTD
jgi:hyaluronoglucosaminidase